ncbi:MAG: hypothetical protein ACPGRD_09460 [Planktomarina sp.]
MDVKTADPKGLIRESYRIEGITLEECKTIFFDWAVQIPNDATPSDYVQFCLDYYGGNAIDHPMSGVLKLALAPAPKAKRRGGRQGRVTVEGRRRDGRVQ